MNPTPTGNGYPSDRPLHWSLVVLRAVCIHPANGNAHSWNPQNRRPQCCVRVGGTRIGCPEPNPRTVEALNSQVAGLESELSHAEPEKVLWARISNFRILDFELDFWIGSKFQNFRLHVGITFRL